MVTVGCAWTKHKVTLLRVQRAAVRDGKSAEFWSTFQSWCIFYVFT